MSEICMMIPDGNSDTVRDEQNDETLISIAGKALFGYETPRNV